MYLNCKFARRVDTWECSAASYIKRSSSTNWKLNGIIVLKTKRIILNKIIISSIVHFFLIKYIFILNTF